ncbi:MAG TPA: thioredoxin family protein, partial [Candidatus Limnocylindria bacterium]|nr:thioredoxin family protein [Candidatus Limnocylindria bacterium]
LTDYDAALKQAKDENKLVLIDFTGSDWCGWCIKLKSEVFDQPEFAAFANANLVLLEVDFPRRKTLSAAQRSANAKLADLYNVRGYPTVFILNTTGRPISQINYEGGGASAFIQGLKKIPRVSWNAPEPESARPNSPVTKKPAGTDEPLWGGLMFPPKRYEELKLTGLSGPANRRLAIVNNQTFAPGETARVKLHSGEVKVLCKEIGTKSVLVQVEGAAAAKELFLSGN